MARPRRSRKKRAPVDKISSAKRLQSQPLERQKKWKKKNDFDFFVASTGDDSIRENTSEGRRESWPAPQTYHGLSREQSQCLKSLAFGIGLCGSLVMFTNEPPAKFISTYNLQ